MKKQVLYRNKTKKELDWEDKKYNCYEAKIGRLISIGISWQTDGYRIRINSLILKGTTRDLEKAKEIGIKAARSLIEESLKVLKEIE